MIKIERKVDCCGCWACENVCPKQCISMKEDEEGFRYPLVDTEVCIDCHLCEKVCPIINVKPQVVAPQDGYLLQIKDDAIRHESTSGGSFTAIAEWVIGQGGVVFGASMNESLDGVVHRKAESMEELAAFRNSKYVQSSVGDTFSQVKKLLNEGRWVCYSGTPCQIEGLTSFLRKDYERLVLIDVVCYGIPSPGFFRNYVAWQRTNLGGNFKKILFREKRLSYNYTSFSIFNDDPQRDYHRGVERDKFMRSFFSDRNVRPSCYDCRFKKRYRVSDFTIWDCYDVRKFSKTLDEDGTNRVLVHSQLGRRIMEEIKPAVRLEKYDDISRFIADEKAMVESVPKPADRKAFFDDYESMPFGNFIEKWFPDTLKVRTNSFIRYLCFRLGIYNVAKRTVKKLLGRN